MARALRLARRGRYSAAPNPCVGCVIAKDRRVLAEGWHASAGGPHAEINALNQIADARAATVYVTLEPCSHQGRTPPCAPALIKAGARAVVVAMRDPNPRVTGRGIAGLVAAGIPVREGLLEAEARALNPGFIKRMTRGLPYLRLKLALSLDGRTALANGASRWISGRQSRQDAHRLRAASAAILSGVATVLRDDPRLNVRGVPFDYRPPLRVILDRGLRCPPAARLFQAPGGAVIYTQHDAAGPRQRLRQAGAEVVTLAPSADWLGDVLRHLAAAFEINDIMAEAGARLSGALIEAGLADELILYVAPKLLGHEARPLLNLPRLERLQDAVEAEPVDVRQLGPDLRLIYRLGNSD